MENDLTRLSLLAIDIADPTTTAERILAISKRLRAVPRFFSIPTMTMLHYRTGGLVARTLKLDKFATRLGECVSMVFVRFIWPRGIPLEDLQECKECKTRYGLSQL